MPDRRALPRRSFLLVGGGALGATLLMGGCADDDAGTTISPDRAALDTALTGELALIAAFTPGVDGSVAEQRRGQAALRSHRAHADALEQAGATASPTPPAAATVARAPRDLVRLQRAQADRLERLALGVSPRIALLLGSIAASDSATAALLGSGR